MTDINTYTTAEISALTPQSGDLVLNTETNAVQLWNGAAWKVFDSDLPRFNNGYSLNFDGTNDELYTNYTQAAGSAISVSFWMNVSDTTSPISFLRYGTSTTDLGLDLLSNSSMQFQILFKNASGQMVYSAIGPANSQL